MARAPDALTPGRSRHIVQLFDDRDTRADAVAAFAAEGLGEGARVLLFLNRAYRDAIERRLSERGVGVQDALNSRALTILDARATLDELMDGLHPSGERFLRTVGRLIGALASGDGPRLRIYGEMVDLLAESADFASALRLEALWNELAREHVFCLLCGYGSAHFGPRSNSGALDAICRAHTSVATSGADPLGAWLTGAARP